jgi:hypothetical protein
MNRERAAKVVSDFLIKVSFDGIYLHFHKQLKNMQYRFKAQVTYNRLRMDKLKKFYQEGFIDYKSFLTASTKATNKKLLDKYGSFNKKYNDKLLILYHNRCKMLNKFAFLQYRSLKPTVNVSQCQDSFDCMKKTMKKTIKIIKRL